jgi:crotonobetainyl-CoA:carnitine CoA-transferase CaiB-like acyl-CoA transferase
MGYPKQRQEQGLHFGLFPCKDGYVSLSVRHEPTWEHLWIFLGNPDFARDERFDTAAKRRKNESELSGILLPQIARYTREELLTGLSPLRIMVGPANSIDDLMDDEHLKERKSLFSYNGDQRIKMPSNPSKMTESPWDFRNSAPLTSETHEIRSDIFDAVKENNRAVPVPVSQGPLRGFRAIVLTQAWAGSYCTQLLGDLGMEVIQVESVNRLDPWRGGLPPKLNGMYANNDPGERPWNRNAQYNSVNRSKKGITLDLNNEECRSALLDLVKISDVFIENFSGRVIGNLGLDYESLREVNPSIVMLRMPTYGTYGPYSNFPGNGGTTEPVSGMSHLIGYPGGPPLNSGIMHTDAYCGILSAGAALTALRYRLATGKGQFVEVSQQEGTMSLLAEYLMDASHNKSAPSRQGNLQRNAAPQGCYMSLDKKWIALSIIGQKQWNSFCKSLDLESLIVDSRFSTKESRQKNFIVLDRILSDVIKKNDAHTFSEKIRNNGIPCELVLDTLEVATKEEFHDMDLFEELIHKETGTYGYVSPPWNFSKTRATVQSPAPTLGEHTESILRDFTDRDASTIMDLIRSGHIGTDPAK